MPTVFDGQFLVQPQSRVLVDDSQLANLNPGAQNVLALIGIATGGVPQQGTLVSDPTTARRLLRSGDLLDATLLAFDPSAQTGGATQIYVVRANSATQSYAKVLDTAGSKSVATVTVAGTFSAGASLTVTIGGVAVPYVTTAGDTNVAGVASSLALAINTTVALQNGSTGVTAVAVGAVVSIYARAAGVDGNSITLTATPGAAFTLTASSATLLTGTGNTLFTLYSDDWGIYTSQIYYSFAAATTLGFKATIGLASNGNITGGLVVQDNINRPLLIVRYTGAAASCTATINDTTFVTTSANASESLNLSFAQFPTVQQLSDYLNATGLYSSVVQPQAGTLATSAMFDKITAQDIKTAVFNLNGHLRALVDWLNSSACPFISCTRAVNPASIAPYYNVNNLYLGGGTEGTSTVLDWTNAISSLQTVDCQIITPVTNSAAIHAAVLTHCGYMSTTGRRPRVAVCGGALGEYSAYAATPTATITARALALNTDRIMLVTPGISYYDVNQNLQTKDSSFTAALVAGMLAAVPPGTPLTHKYVSNVVSLETIYKPSDLDTLLLNGVAPLQFIQNKGFRICQSLTTWTATSNFVHNEISTRLAVDTVSRRVQDALDDIVGNIVAPETLARAVSVCETILKGCQSDKLIVGDKNSPAFQNITASTSGGGIINVSFQISPAIPANYILCTISTVPYTGSVGTSS